MAKKNAPIHVLVQRPKDEAGKRELAGRVAQVHADLVGQYLQKLNCPSGQKLQLLDALIRSAGSKKAGVK